jgi:DNA-binding HxlR family transcriptional regulator
MTKNKTFLCPVEVTLQAIDGRWKTLILWELREKTLRFSELKRCMPEITQRVLTQQLRELESDGIIRRKIYPVIPPRVEYSLTDLGRSLRPVLDVMCAWGVKRFKQLSGAKMLRQL